MTVPSPPVSDAESTPGTGLDLRRVILGFVGFVSLGVLGVWAVARLVPEGRVSLSGLLGAASPTVLAACVGLALLDVVLGGARLHLWVSRVAPGTRPGACLWTYMVNLFAAAVSPMGSAAAPAQVAALARFGVAPARSLAALVLKFISVLAAFLLVCGVALGYLTLGSGLRGTTGAALRGLLGVVLAVTILVVVAVMNPVFGARLARGLERRGEHRGGRTGRLLARGGRALARGVSEYRAALHVLRSDWHRPMVGSVALSSVMLLNKCLIGYLLAVNMGYVGPYAEVAARQSIQWLLIYFSPSPGGSGLAEATVPAFLAGIVAPGRIVEYTIQWRLVTGFIGPGLGALATLRLFGRGRLDREMMDRPGA